MGRTKFRGDEKRLFDYLGTLSAKYQVNLDTLLEAIYSARQGRTKKARVLAIKAVERTPNHSTFLVTRNEKVVAQVKVPKKTLEALRDADEICRQETILPSTRNARWRGKLQISSLEAGMNRVELEASVTEKSTPKIVMSRYTGTPLQLAVAKLTDKTGSVKMSLWNDQVNMVFLGDTVRIENGCVRLFNGEKMVNLGRKGRVTVLRRSLKRQSPTPKTVTEARRSETPLLQAR
ncbi:MAG: hypothetical protein ACE5KO_03690 [Candidatus Bathyarchaeia archaeon]